MLKTNPTKRYLSKYKDAELERRILIEELEKMTTEAAGIRAFDYASEKVQTTATTDQIFNIVVRIEERSKHIGSRCIELENIMRTIRDEITSVDDYRYKRLLYLRYISGKDLLTISKELNYDYDYIRKLHGKALNYFKKNTKKNIAM